MENQYYLALFNETTWNEFLLKNLKIYGTTKINLQKSKKISNGDYLICYISKRSKFVGILEIASKVYYDESHIWDTDTFPVRFNVNPVYVFSIRDGIHISQIKERLSIFKKLKNKEKWGGFFMNSFNHFSYEDSQTIYEELKKVFYLVSDTA